MNKLSGVKYRSFSLQIPSMSHVRPYWQRSFLSPEQLCPAVKLPVCETTATTSVGIVNNSLSLSLLKNVLNLS